MRDDDRNVNTWRSPTGAKDDGLCDSFQHSKYFQLLTSTLVHIDISRPVAYPGIFFEGVQQIQLRTEEWGSGGGNPPVRGSGGSCNLVQEISFHIVKFSQFLVL